MVAHPASPAIHLHAASDTEARRAALQRLAAALGRAEARRLARPGRGTATEGAFLFAIILLAAVLLATVLAGAGR